MSYVNGYDGRSFYRDHTCDNCGRTVRTLGPRRPPTWAGQWEGRTTTTDICGRCQGVKEKSDVK